MKSIIHQVPYYSQWESPDLAPDILDGTLLASSDPLWERSGAQSPEEYEYWSWRLCGMACLRMALDFWWGVSPAPVALAQECLAAGAYIRHPDGRLDGLIHAPFATYAHQRWGLAAEARSPLDAGESPALLEAGRLAMLPAHPGEAARHRPGKRPDAGSDGSRPPGRDLHGPPPGSRGVRLLPYSR